MLTALVQGRVHVWHPPGDARRDLVPHGGDVPPGDGVDRALGEQSVDLVGDLPWRPGAVDDDEPQLAGEHPALRVHLVGSELSAQFTGRTENPCRALQGYDQRDVEGRPATGRRVGPNGSSGHSAKLVLR